MSYQSITTLATTTPAQGNAQLTMGSGTSCLVIDTGPADITEPYFFLYVRLGSGSVKKIRTECYSRHIIPTEVGDTVAIGSDSARSITVRQSVLPSLTTPTGWETATSFSDHAEPRVWEPQSRHIATATVKKIIILPEGDWWRDIWISDYDGANWSPARHIRTHPQYTPSGVTVPVFGVGVALCTQDGATVQVKLSADANVQGQSHIYELPMPTITSQVLVDANDGSDFLSKLQAATAGTEVVLPAGTYTVASQITTTDWAQGVTVSGQTGDADDVIIEAADVADGLWLHQSGWTLQRGLRDFTLAISSTHGNAAFDSVGVRVSNVKFQGDGTGSDNLVNCRLSGTSDRKFFNCEFNDAPVDGINTDQGNPVWLINCRGARAGSTSQDQLVTSHNSSNIYVLGGHYEDAHTNVMAIASGGRQYCEYMRYGKGNRNSGMTGTNMRGCRTTSHNGGIQTSCDWLVRNIWSGANENMLRNYNGILHGNIFEDMPNTRTIYKDSSGDVVYTHNQFIRCGPTSGATAILYHGNGGSAHTQHHRNTGFRDCTRGVIVVGTPVGTFRFGNAIGSATTTFEISESSGDLSKIQSDFGVYSRANSGFAAATPGPGEDDILGTEPAIAATLLPTASGNCDNTGDPTLYDWIGGRGFTAQPLIYDLGVSSRGALTRPQSGEIFPDVWNAEAVATSTEQDPDPEGEAPVGNIFVVQFGRDTNAAVIGVVWLNSINVNGQLSNVVLTIRDGAGNVVMTGTPTVANNIFRLTAESNVLQSSRRYSAHIAFDYQSESYTKDALVF